MKIKFNCLMNELNLLSVVFSKSAASTAKTVYFHDGCIVGFSPLMMTKSSLEVEGEFLNCALSFESLSKIMQGYSNLYFTVVEDVEITEVGKAIKVVVYETPKEGIEGASSFAKSAEFILDNAPVAQSVLAQFERVLPDNAELVHSDDLSLYMKTLYPLLSNDSSGSSAGKLSFAEDFVFFLSNTFSSFVVNILPDSMKDLEITQSGLSLVRKMFERCDALNIGREEGYLVVSTPDESLSCYIRVNKVTFKYKKLVESLSKERGIVLNRRYFREVLSRVGGFSENVSLKYENDALFVDAKTFSQDVPVEVAKGIDGSIGFMANTNIMDKIIIGSDDLMAPEVFLYLVDKGRNIGLYVSDSSGEWFSITSVMSV